MYGLYDRFKRYTSVQVHNDVTVAEAGGAGAASKPNAGKAKPKAPVRRKPQKAVQRSPAGGSDAQCHRKWHESTENSEGESSWATDEDDFSSDGDCQLDGATSSYIDIRSSSLHSASSKERSDPEYRVMHAQLHHPTDTGNLRS